MRSWGIWAAAAVLAASPAMAREHRGGGRDGGGQRGGNSGGGRSDRDRDRSDRGSSDRGSRPDRGADRGARADRGGSARDRSDRGGTSAQADRSNRDRDRDRGNAGQWSGNRESRQPDRAVPRDSGNRPSRDFGSRGDQYRPSNRGHDRGYDYGHGYSYGGHSTPSHRYTPSYGHRYTPSYSRYRRPYYVSFYYRHRPAYYYRSYPTYVYGSSYYDYDDASYSYDNDGAVRVLVEPSETKVFVDGYYAGTADDFDGIFQRLYLRPGRHEIALKLDGFRTWSAEVYASAGHTLKLHHDMVRGDGAEEMERFSENAGEDEAESRDMATLHLDVQPPDAAVYIDGELFNLAQKDIPVPAGGHSVEVVRPGYRAVTREFEARPSGTVELRVDLVKTDTRASDGARAY